MSKTPTELRAEAKSYRQLHKYMSGAVITPAIESVAEALDDLANAIEAPEILFRR